MTTNDLRHKNSFSREELLKVARGEVFGPQNAKLPLPNMLMLDRILRINDSGGRHGRGEILAEFDITPDLWFFDCHFVGDPVMPGCLGLDAMWQLLGFFMTWCGHEGRGRALGVGDVRFRGQVLPENKVVTYHIHIRRILARKLILGLGDGEVLVDGRSIYAVTGMRVGLFSSLGDFEQQAAEAT